MKYLLDVNVLLAGIWSSHPKHPITFTWLPWTADLAAKHGCKLGTLDGGIKHAMAELIAWPESSYGASP